MPAIYAEKLVELGYTTFTFDFAGFGASPGSPRQTEIPTRKIVNILDAADFVSTMSFVRQGAVGHLAICASTQYTLAALARGAKIASFASVAGWYHDAASVAPFYGGTDGVARRMEDGQAALADFRATGKVLTVPACDAGNEKAGMFFEMGYYAKQNRGAVPAWKNEMSPMTWLYWLTFQGMPPAADVAVPSVFVHGDGCVLPANAKRVFDCLKGRKRLMWMEGSQTDFHDQEPFVSRAVAVVHEHFSTTLNMK